MAFERFFYKSRMRGPFVKVNKNTITVSRSLVDKHNLTQYAAVELSYDRADRMMSLRFLPEKEVGTVATRRGSVFILAAKCFIDHFGIQHGCYMADWDDGKTTFVCYYNETEARAA